MSTQTRKRTGHDVWTLLGVGVVAVAAAVLSFSSLQALAVRAGYTPALAALLPLAIDAQAVVATRAWLTSSPDQRAYRYARRLALAAVVSSVAGNAGQHAMTAAGVLTPWWVVVAIASVPPVALAATAHLAALLVTHDRDAETATGEHAASTVSAHARTAEHVGERSSHAPSERSEGARSSAHDTLHDADRVSAHAAAHTPHRSPRTKSDAKPAAKPERARALFDRHAEAGTLDQLTGTDIATAGGVSRPTGRRWLKAWRAEHDRPQLAVVGEQT